ncbi:hypothetical protein OESDEN_20184 [Oesophagostomum dentatum]|uniref:Lipid-binding serum glycoprotein N-terminal domain-containing protein n=1 Tax=Oesophagostomum dentatum TaxID=61180 RepID=A0A0B1S9I2_OESDE|nr:hypothetical protein OESDEN_20184 [Oesophagostomum dentatum]
MFTRCENKIDANEPLTLTISPKVWNLLETKANIIQDAVKSIEFPELSGRESLVKYRVWDGRVEHFEVPKSGVSFVDMNNGVHLRIHDVKFRVVIRGRVELGKKVFGKWVRIARMSGDIKVQSEDADLDVTLVWNDFKLTPASTMNSNVRVDFTHHLRNLNFLRKKLQDTVRSKINSEVPKKINEAIEQKVNPRLQKLKQKLISMGYKDYDIEWTVQNNILRAAIKPKSATKEISPVQPIDHMLCVNANVMEVISAVSSRSKRNAVRVFFLEEREIRKKRKK